MASEVKDGRLVMTPPNLQNIQSDITFANERQFAKWFEKNFTLLGFDSILKKHTQHLDYTMSSNGCKVRVELETLSSHFVSHKHDPTKIDLVVCLRKDEELPLPVIELPMLKFESPTAHCNYINVNIDDNLEIEVRRALPRLTKLHGKKGALKEAVEAGLRLWLAEGNTS